MKGQQASSLHPRVVLLHPLLWGAAHLILLVKVSLEFPQHCLRKPKPQGEHMIEHAGSAAAVAAEARVAEVSGKSERLRARTAVRVSSFVVEEPVMLCPR